jgi:hypothetical protein
MGKLEVKMNKDGAKLNVILGGSIDEDVDFTKLNLAEAQEIDLELGGIKSINSCGIREWIKWMATNKEAVIHFNKCPKVIVDQINMVDGFLPSNAKVNSFFVPYYNDDSGAEKNVLFRYGTEFSEGTLNPPPAIKDDQGNDMEMDVIESKYFKFIKR